ncbi:hypothetical protein LCL97_15645 [Seohaeicola saemankumensis]|nr:hypothetical protein [Seohaeicola saemankumensis]MCA0872269.1 hypothetical protein [Seohaeicola saemankumensis]
MTTRPLTEFLTVIAEEIAALSGIAHTLDDHLDEIARAAPDLANLSILQTADTLRQYLDDLSSVSGFLADKAPDGVDIEVAGTCSAAQLSDLRARLCGAASQSRLTASSHGDIEWY